MDDHVFDGLEDDYGDESDADSICPRLPGFGEDAILTTPTAWAPRMFQLSALVDDFGIDAVSESAVMVW